MTRSGKEILHRPYESQVLEFSRMAKLISHAANISIDARDLDTLRKEIVQNPIASDLDIIFKQEDQQGPFDLLYYAQISVFYAGGQELPALVHRELSFSISEVQER